MRTSLHYTSKEDHSAKITHMENFPTEITTAIFSWLDKVDVFTASHVCWQWRNVIPKKSQRVHIRDIIYAAENIQEWVRESLNLSRVDYLCGWLICKDEANIRKHYGEGLSLLATMSNQSSLGVLWPNNAIYVKNDLIFTGSRDDYDQAMTLLNNMNKIYKYVEYSIFSEDMTIFWKAYFEYWYNMFPYGWKGPYYNDSLVLHKMPHVTAKMIIFSRDRYEIYNKYYTSQPTFGIRNNTSSKYYIQRELFNMESSYMHNKRMINISKFLIDSRIISDMMPEDIICAVKSKALIYFLVHYKVVPNNSIYAEIIPQSSGEIINQAKTLSIPRRLHKDKFLRAISLGFTIEDCGKLYEYMKFDLDPVYVASAVLNDNYQVFKWLVDKGCTMGPNEIALLCDKPEWMQYLKESSGDIYRKKQRVD